MKQGRLLTSQVISNGQMQGPVRALRWPRGARNLVLRIQANQGNPSRVSSLKTVCGLDITPKFLHP